jgi:hypothetical protein
MQLLHNDSYSHVVAKSGLVYTGAGPIRTCFVIDYIPS